MLGDKRSMTSATFFPFLNVVISHMHAPQTTAPLNIKLHNDQDCDIEKERGREVARERKEGRDGCKERKIKSEKGRYKKIGE